MQSLVKYNKSGAAIARTLLTNVLSECNGRLIIGSSSYSISSSAGASNLNGSIVNAGNISVRLLNNIRLLSQQLFNLRTLDTSATALHSSQPQMQTSPSTTSSPSSASSSSSSLSSSSPSASSSTAAPQAISVSSSSNQSSASIRTANVSASVNKDGNNLKASSSKLHLVTAYSGLSKEHIFDRNVQPISTSKSGNQQQRISKELSQSSPSSANNSSLLSTTSHAAVAAASSTASMLNLNKKGKVGDDAWFIVSQKYADVLGVADGVGGWRDVGVDPSKFSTNLMKSCKRIVEQNLDQYLSATIDSISSNASSSTSSSSPSASALSQSISSSSTSNQTNLIDAINNSLKKMPIDLLSQSYNTLLENKNSIIGSSTACIILYHRDTSYLHSANLGDSGFAIIRNNKIIHKSQEQQHYFNSPYQLAIFPPEEDPNLISDRPDMASTSSIELFEGDFIVVATDGLWDNLSDVDLLREISKIKVRL
jgi:protein phosphatase PTC7